MSKQIHIKIEKKLKQDFQQALADKEPLETMSGKIKKWIMEYIKENE